MFAFWVKRGGGGGSSHQLDRNQDFSKQIMTSRYRETPRTNEKGVEQKIWPGMSRRKILMKKKINETSSKASFHSRGIKFSISMLHLQLQLLVTTIIDYYSEQRNFT